MKKKKCKDCGLPTNPKKGDINTYDKQGNYLHSQHYTCWAESYEGRRKKRRKKKDQKKAQERAKNWEG